MVKNSNKKIRKIVDEKIEKANLNGKTKLKSIHMNKDSYNKLCEEMSDLKINLILYNNLKVMIRKELLDGEVIVS